MIEMNATSQICWAPSDASQTACDLEVILTVHLR